ncbi:MAG: hypothetical protein RLZ98_1292 [Pseudomonadota bacterium]|jgi:hypothetical protein
MSGKVIDMSGRTSSKSGEPVPEIIELLESLLAEAKQGQIQHFAFVTVDPHGISGDGYVPGGTGPDLVTVVGGLEICKASLLAEILADERDAE